MRTPTNFYTSQSETLLGKLADSHTSIGEYRETFHLIGTDLAEILNKELPNYGPTLLACSSEDADWLAEGVLEGLSIKNTALAVFWNDRIYPNPENKAIVASPIVKSYIEDIEDCRNLIIVKSIIFTSCVVKTQLTRLIEKITPDHIFIVSPVMFKGAEENLRNEFPSSISSKFQFIYLVTDDEQNEQGEVVPGIGGMVYQRLGLGDNTNKNKYIPSLIRKKLGL